MQNIKDLPRNENGSVMVAAIMILVLLTIVGMAAMNTSTTESSLSTNTLLYQRAFYTAEAGFEHAKAVLKVPFTEQNQANIAAGGSGNWSFALDGSGVIAGLEAATNSDGDIEEVGDYGGAVTLLQSQLGGISYTVKIWNNDDGGTYKNDTDGRIMVRTIATGPRGEVCSIESLIEGTSSTGNMDGYKAQAGAGAGKSYRNNDLETITNFDWQVGNPSP